MQKLSKPSPRRVLSFHFSKKSQKNQFIVQNKPQQEEELTTQATRSTSASTHNYPNSNDNISQNLDQLYQKNDQKTSKIQESKKENQDQIEPELVFKEKEPPKIRMEDMTNENDNTLESFELFDFKKNQKKENFRYNYNYNQPQYTPMTMNQNLFQEEFQNQQHQSPCQDLSLALEKFCFEKDYHAAAIEDRDLEELLKEIDLDDVLPVMKRTTVKKMGKGKKFSLDNDNEYQKENILYFTNDQLENLEGVASKFCTPSVKRQRHNSNLNDFKGKCLKDVKEEFKIFNKQVEGVFQNWENNKSQYLKQNVSLFYKNNNNNNSNNGHGRKKSACNLRYFKDQFVENYAEICSFFKKGKRRQSDAQLVGYGGFQEGVEKKPPKIV